MAEDDREGRLMTPCNCASIPFQFEPHKERAADATIVQNYRATSGATEGERAASIYSRLTRHESGHCVAAVAFKKTIHHLTIGAGQPHLCYDLLSGEATVDALALINVAGFVAEGSPAPTWGDMHESLQRAREKITGICDMCKLFDLVVSACPERDGREIINTIYDTFETAADLFRSPEWSGALDALASALESQTLLTGDDITRITSTFDLTEPLETIKPIWTTNP